MLRALAVAGAALGIGASAVAAGCGKSSKDPKAPDTRDAASEVGGGAGGNHTGGAATDGGRGATSEGGRPRGASGNGASGFLTVGGSGGALEPGTSAQWNCDGAFERCQGTATGPYSMNAAGLLLSRACSVESSRPRSRADCGEAEELTCDLAVDASGAQLLVNCECTKMGTRCGTCTSRTTGDEVPAQCSNGIRICPCAYVGNR
jgi:hypothetical protein